MRICKDAVVIFLASAKSGEFCHSKDRMGVSTKDLNAFLEIAENEVPRVESYRFHVKI